MESDAFNFSLLENGYDFLLSSLEHLNAAATNDQKRHLKYALLHACSAVELIFKERLRQEHWSLVFAEVSKATRKAYGEGDFRSVTFEEAQTRLKGICQIEFKGDEERDLKNFRQQRNRIEHFDTVASIFAVRARIVKMVTFIVDFAHEHLDEAGRMKEMFLEGTIRSKLGECKAVVEHRWKEIESPVKSRGHSVECPDCHQVALSSDGDGTARCLFCRYSGKSHVVAEEYMNVVLGLGPLFGEEIGKECVNNCPECGDKACVDPISGPLDSFDGYCFGCGRLYPGGATERCPSCSRIYEAVSEHVCPEEDAS